MDFEKKKENNRHTIHFNADSSNTELSFRTIHSANQLSIYGAVSSWCEEFGLRPNEREKRGREREPTSERLVAKENEQLLKRVKPQELNSLVQTPRSDNLASGNRLRECLKRFETLEKDIQFTIPDVDDGFGDRTPACRKYTLLRENSDSRVYATTLGPTFIGPVLQVHIIQHLGINGIETQIPSTTTKKSNFLGGDMPREEPLRGGVTSQ